MNKIVEILMRRDHMSQADAEDVLNQAVDELEANGYQDGEDIMMETLGLEMDYIFDLIEFAERRPKR